MIPPARSDWVGPDEPWWVARHMLNEHLHKKSLSIALFYNQRACFTQVRELGCVGGAYVVGERGKLVWNDMEGGMYEARLGMLRVCPELEPVGVGLELGGAGGWFWGLSMEVELW